jgi:hypothetical protein
MPPMPGRALRITSRIVFVLCGLTSLFTCVPYVMLQGVDMPFQSEWIIFVIVMALVGCFSVVIGLLPASRIAKMCRKDRDDPKLFSIPFKVLGILAAIGYLVAVVGYLAPHSWDLNPQFMFPLCPMYFVKMTFDPSPVAIFFLLAPMNAAVYGALGVTLRHAWLAFRRAN